MVVSGSFPDGVPAFGSGTMVSVIPLYRGIYAVGYIHIDQGFSHGAKNFLPQDFHKNP